MVFENQFSESNVDYKASNKISIFSFKGSAHKTPGPS